MDGVEGEKLNGVVGNWGFSPDSKWIVYVASRDGKEFLVVDGAEGPQYDGIEGIDFGLDSKRDFFLAKRGEKLLIVADGIEGNQFDEFLGTFWGSYGDEEIVSRSTTLVLDTPRSFHALAVRNKMVIRIEVEIVEE